MSKRFLLSLGLLGALTSCGSSSDDNAFVRVVHISPNAGVVDIGLDQEQILDDDDKLRFERVGYKESSGYSDIQPGVVLFKAKPTGVSESVEEEVHVIEKDKYYTTFVADVVTSLDFVVVEDERKTPPSGFASVRAVHGAPGAPTVDIYVTTPTDDLSGNPTLEDVDFQDVSGYLDLPEGDYRIRVTPANTKTVAIDSGTVSLKNGDVVTAVATDKEGGGAPFSLLFLSDKI
jgi:hypothetical protein